MSFWGDEYTSRPKAVGRWVARGLGYGTGRGRRLLLAGGFVAMLAIVLTLMLIPFFLKHEDSARNSYGNYNDAIPALAQNRGSKADTELSVVQIAAQVKPAVVSVINYLEEPEDQEDQLRNGSGYGLGSGIIFGIHKSQALVVTNHHVIDGGVAYEIVLTTGERREAKLIGSDVFTDLAVMSINSQGLEKVAMFGDSDKLQAGESVVAIGNPLGISYSQTITAGIVSSLRTLVPVSLGQNGQIDWEVELIQTDAAINRGNSGGALVNMRGEVIGINSMKVSDYGVEGLGFAIPVNDAIEVIGDLLEHGKVKRPFIGVATMDLSMFLDGADTLELPDGIRSGVIVMSAEGPAAEAGLLMSDVIVRLDETEIDSTLELRKYLYEVKKIGEKVKVTFYRQGELQTVKLELQERES
jgi:serine protease Do